MRVFDLLFGAMLMTVALPSDAASVSNRGDGEPAPKNGDSIQPVTPAERATEPNATPVAPVVPEPNRIEIPTDRPSRSSKGDDTDTHEDLALTTKELLEQGSTSKETANKPAAKPPVAAPAPRPVLKKPAFVEMVFVIDTTGSMGGLIKSAKEKIWFIINEVASAHPAPEIRIGFVIYRDVGDEYVTKVYPMEEDFNYVVENMDQFKAVGGGDGPEHVSLALQDAVTKMNWSKKGTGYRVIFLVGDAPPHTDYKDGANYKTACQQAVQQRTIVNAVRCGTDAYVDSFWREIAKIGFGQFLTIPQDGGAASIPTPVDAQIGELVDELESATLPLPGRETDQQRNAKVTAGLSAAAKADKGCLYTKTTQQLIRWDFITACVVGRVKLEDVPDDKLPEALRALPKEERARFVSERVAQRKVCLAQIARLEPVRRRFIAQAMAKKGVKGNAAEGFDQAVIRTIRLQGSWFGMKW